MANSATVTVTEWVKRTPHVFRNLFRSGNRSIGTRLTACFAIILLLMIAADVIAVWQFNRMAAPGQRLNQANQTSHAVMRVHLDVDAFRDRLSALASTHDTRQFTSEATSLRRKFLENVAHAQQLLRSSPDIEQDPMILSGLETLQVTLPSQLDAVMELAAANDWPAVRLRLADQVPSLIDLGSLLVERVDEEVLHVRAEAIESAKRARRQLFLVVPITALLTLLTAVALGWYTTRAITDPLSELDYGAQALARGEFQHEVVVGGEDELATLGKAFNYAARRIRELYETVLRSEKQLRDVIENVPAMVFIALPGPSNEFASRRWREYTGLSVDDTTGSGWQSVIHPEDLERHLGKWRVCSATGELFEDEARFRRAADREYRWFLVRAVPLRDEAGTILKWYGVLTDIEDLKRAEEGLRESERRYRYIFQAAGVSIWEEDFSQVKAAIDELKAQGVRDFRQYLAEHPEFIWQVISMVKVIDVNDATVKLFAARNKEELLVSLDKVLGLIPVPEIEEVFAGELIAIAEGQTSFESESVGQTLNGDKLTVLFKITFPPQPSRLDKVLVSLMDITERKRAEVALQKAQEELAHITRVTAMGELTSSIAHEVNQPLTAVVTNGSACLRWLASEPPNLDEARESVGRIIREGHRASEVITRIRSLVKKSAPEKAELDINAVIEEVVALVHPEVLRKQVLLRTELASDLLPVLGDRVQLQQVLLNLSLNGIEAMSAVTNRPRILSIKSQRHDSDGVLVAVQDSGLGIEAQNFAQLFDAFFTTKPDGMGMGLSISRSIIEAHAGRLWVTANDGWGATFQFILPNTR
jgi:PAS domain S-box-containing protein